ERAGTQTDLRPAIQALEICRRRLPIGHPWRAGTLSHLALAMLRMPPPDNDPQSTLGIVDLALEAEAIVDSGAQANGWNPRCIAGAEAAWRQAGRDDLGFASRRAAAASLLVEALPEAALRLAVARGGAAVNAGAIASAASYAMLACNGRDR